MDHPTHRVGRSYLCLLLLFRQTYQEKDQPDWEDTDSAKQGQLQNNTDYALGLLANKKEREPK
jgi:hypothetical protein